jgi:hypothetical protein
MHRRYRSKLALTLAAAFLSVALALIWLVTYCFWIQIPVRLFSHLYCLDFSVGCIWISDYSIWNAAAKPVLDEPRSHFFTSFFGDEAGWRARPSFLYTGPSTTAPPPGSQLNIRWQLILPLYPFFLALGIPSALMVRTEWKSRRHAREGNCRKCGYDLAGISGPCPECGTSQA